MCMSETGLQNAATSTTSSTTSEPVSPPEVRLSSPRNHLLLRSLMFPAQITVYLSSCLDSNHVFSQFADYLDIEGLLPSLSSSFFVASLSDSDTVSRFVLVDYSACERRATNYPLTFYIEGDDGSLCASSRALASLPTSSLPSHVCSQLLL